jgi:hypothetical protein
MIEGNVERPEFSRNTWFGAGAFFEASIAR